MHSSLISFSTTYDARRDAAINRRVKAKKAEIEYKEQVGEDALKAARVAKAVAVEAAYQAVGSGTATKADRELVNTTEEINRVLLRRRGEQTAQERIYTVGHVYPGSHVSGLVAGKAHQSPQTTFGLASEDEPLLKRVIASMGSPKRRKKKTDPAPKNSLRTGPAADKCWRQMKPLVAHDEVYGFFSVNCFDMWRHDCDSKPGEKVLYASEAHALADLHDKHSTGELKLLPQFGVYTPDELFPDAVPSVHWFYILPDDGNKRSGRGSSGYGQGRSCSCRCSIRCRQN